VSTEGVSVAPIEPEPRGTGTDGEPELRHGAIGVGGALMQNIANIAPAVAALFTLSTIVEFSGKTAPLAYLLAFFFITLCSGYVLAQFTHHLPSGGSYFTFLSRSLNPRIGFPRHLALLLRLSARRCPGRRCLRVDYRTDAASPVRLHLPLVGVPADRARGHRGGQHPGIKFGIRVLAVLSIAELVVILALAFSGLLDPGPGGFSLSGFKPCRSPRR